MTLPPRGAGRGIPKPVISGGEEDVANLVLRLAISQMIAERAGQAFSLLILDEIFGSLDVQRRDAVLALLRSLQARFEQVIVISHIDDVRDGLDQVFSVGFDPETGAAVVTAAEGPRLGPPARRGGGMSGPRVRLVGPHPITVEEIPALNLLFSDAFSERYRVTG